MLLPLKKGAAMSSIPSKLPAYMFSKKPIIGSLDVQSDTARAIIESDCGLVVEPENEQALINAFKEAVHLSLIHIWYLFLGDGNRCYLCRCTRK